MAHEPPVRIGGLCGRIILGLYSDAVPDDCGGRDGDTRQSQLANLGRAGMDYQSLDHAPDVLFQLLSGHLVAGGLPPSR